MSLRKYLKDKPFFFCLLFCLVSGVSYAGEAEEDSLSVVVKELVEELRENNILHGSDYSPVKTDIAAVIDRDDVQQFFSSIEKISSLTNTVEKISKNMEVVTGQVAVLRSSDSAQDAEIERNKLELRDLRYALGWLGVTLLTGLPAAHVYAHRNDKNKDEENE